MSAATTSPVASTRPSNLKLALVFAVMVTVWSFSFVVVKVVTREVPPLFAALLRAVGTAVALAPVAMWRARQTGHTPFQRKDLPRLAATALIGISINQMGFIVGVSSTSVAHSSIVLSLAPVLVLVAAMIAGQERAGVRQLAGMALAMAGVVWLQIGRGDSGVVSVWGDLAAFMSAAAFGVYSVLNKQLTLRYGGAFVNAACFAIGAVGIAPAGLWAARGVNVSHWSAPVWWGLAYMVLLQGVAGYTIFYYLLTHASASRVSTYNYIQPFTATLFAWMLLGESVPFVVVTAGLVVFAGVWLTVRAQ